MTIKDIPLWGWIAIALSVWNLAAFIVTFSDKLRAKRGGWRVPERRFLVFAAVFGGLGVLAGFYVFRHKTRHTGLLTGVWALGLLSYAAAVTVFLLLR